MTQQKASSSTPHEDLRDRLEFIRTAADALNGLSSMLQSEHLAGDVPLVSARRAEAAAIFRFFGEALRQPALKAYDDVDRIERASHGVQS